MTDDLVKRLRVNELPGDRQRQTEARIELWKILQEAASRIEELNRAVLDLAQYVSSADLGFYIEPETKKVLSEIGGEEND
jgi:hypothetical protein